MKFSNHISTGILLAAAFFIYSCKKDYGNLNSPTIEQFLANANASELNNLVSGTESGMRNNMAYYLDDIGVIGREGYRFSNAEPRYTKDLLGAVEATLNNSTFYITTPWAARYRVVKNCNTLIQAATNSTLITAAEKSGYIGFARTIKAYQLLLNINLTYKNGIRVDVANADQLGAVVTYDAGLADIASILDSADAGLATAVVTFPLAGFTGFSDAAGLAKVNRALAARVAAYRAQWAEVLTDLNGSFFDLTKDFHLGVNHVFATGSGDKLNPMFIPQNQNGEVRVAHASFATDIKTGDDRINKATLRTSTVSLDGLSSNRDVWVYTTSTAPIPIIRNEELILLYAEAKIQTNAFADAVTALDAIRQNHGLPVYSGALIQDALITELLYERRYSLYYEGHRWLDMRRYNKLAELPKDRTGDDVWESFPLPISE